MIPFRSGMDESVVRPSVVDIAVKASELAGRQLKVELNVEPRSPSPAGTRRQPPPAMKADPVAVVERVFRGTRLPDGARGESDELR